MRMAENTIFNDLLKKRYLLEAVSGPGRRHLEKLNLKQTPFPMMLEALLQGVIGVNWKSLTEEAFLKLEMRKGQEIDTYLDLVETLY